MPFLNNHRFQPRIEKKNEMSSVVFFFLDGLTSGCERLNDQQHNQIHKLHVIG